jgi:hypothetical protein
VRSGARSVALAIVTSAVLAACGGGGAAPSGASATSAALSAEPSTSASASPSAASSALASNAASDAPPAATGPCALVTAEEVGAVVGVAVKAVESGEASCIYEVATTGAVVVYTQQTLQGGTAQFGGLKADPQGVTVEGLGDEALWLPAYEAVQLHTRTGDKVLTLALGTLSGVPIDELPTGTSPEVLLDKAKQLATLAISRM